MWVATALQLLHTECRAWPVDGITLHLARCTNDAGLLSSTTSNCFTGAWWHTACAGAQQRDSRTIVTVNGAQRVPALHSV